MTPFRWNPHCHGVSLGPAPERQALAFHRRLPGYRPSRLRSLGDLARELGVGEVLVKDESQRFDLPAFKVLGGSWAVFSLVRELLDDPLEDWRSMPELRERLAPLRPCTLFTATDGNHGRGVAHVARIFGLASHVFVPADTSIARIAAIEGEGAQVSVVDGVYDEAVAAAKKACGESEGRAFLIQDTSWEGYEEVPRRVIEGYSTILWELEDELAERCEAGPDLVLVPIGVGALAAAVIAHFRNASRRPMRVVGVEPDDAACALAALEADRVVTVPGPHRSLMAGLNCGTLASIVWPLVRGGLDATLTVSDARCEEAMRAFARQGVVSGESGSSGLAGLLELLRGPQADEAREQLAIDRGTRVLLINTEGITDPATYERVVSRR